MNSDERVLKLMRIVYYTFSEEQIVRALNQIRNEEERVDRSPAFTQTLDDLQKIINQRNNNN